MRPLWTVRLIFYPAAIGLAALLLAGRLGAGEPGGGWLLGATVLGRRDLLHRRRPGWPLDRELAAHGRHAR